jgi:hypothetical protein
MITNSIPSCLDGAVILISKGLAKERAVDSAIWGD